MPNQRLADAVDAALAWHGGQRRKDGSPYVSHLLQVAGLVLEHGGSWDAAVAAVLHDVTEDTDATIDEVRARFGDEVAAIVEACDDSIEGEGRGADTWRRRKEAYLSHVRDASFPAALVSACDKLHNLRAMARDGAEGFHASVEEQAWFYGELARALSARGDIPAPIIEELRSLIDRALR